MTTKALTTTQSPPKGGIKTFIFGGSTFSTGWAATIIYLTATGTIEWHQDKTLWQEVLSFGGAVARGFAGIF